MTAVPDQTARRDALKALHQMRPWPGAAQTALRIGGQVALVTWAMTAWSRGQWGVYASAAVLSGVWFAGVISLTHDALHRRLTGVGWLDVILARLMSWPIAWPIGVYTVVHLSHHKWAGASLRDPERIQPTMAEYAAASPLRRWYFRNQIWVSVFVTGGVGLLVRLLREAREHRGHLRHIGRATAIDGLGIAAVALVWIAAAYSTGGGQRLAGAVLLWITAERVVGIAHQLRNHAEHYGLWGTHATPMLTQYLNARDIETNRFGAWFFNHLNRHATHHALMGVPFYNLERAHHFLRADLAVPADAPPPARGYLAEVLAANRTARRGAFIAQPDGAVRP